MLNKVMGLISGVGFFAVVFLIAIMPFPLIYKLSDLLAWLLRVVFRYREGVIDKNLTESDLNLTEDEKGRLIKQIYVNIADILIEGIKSFSLTQRQILKRHRVLNPEILNPYFEKGQSVILLTGHLANWEWGSLSAGIHTKYHILAFYKPLKNKMVDKFLRKTRARYDTTLAPVSETSLSFDKHKGRCTLYMMIADQSPWRPEQAHWVNFLGRETPFLHGPEKHSRQNNYPLFFADINRTGRGYYNVSVSLLAENPHELEPGEITRLYAGKLEAVIRANPEKWLWSHKRWKHKRSH